MSKTNFLLKDFRYISDLKVIEKSALAEHNYKKHDSDSDFDLNNYKMMVYNTVNARDLNRQESRLISELRTNVMGLNRMNIKK